jgi:predicted phage-related endonuclease
MMNAPAEQVITHFEEHCVPVRAPGGKPIHSGEREPWLNARRDSMVTASDIAALLGLDPRRDALSVFLSKRHPVKKESLTWEDPRFWGLALEQPIGRIVADYCGWDFHPGGYLLRSKQYPMLGATLDAEVKPANDQWRPYEGKNVSTWLLNDWDVEAQVPPDRVLIQAQTQMMVTGTEAVQTFALIGGSIPRSIEVAPHHELRSMIVEKAEELLDRLKRDDPYPATYKSTEAIKDAFPGDDGSIIELPPEACALIEQAGRLSRDRIQLEREEQSFRNQLRMLMGEACYGRVPGPVMVEREKNGKGYDFPVGYVKCGVSRKAPHYVEGSESRTLMFVKDLPRELKPRRVRMRR